MGNLRHIVPHLIGDITRINNTWITWVMEIQNMAKLLFIQEFQRQIKKMIY